MSRDLRNSISSKVRDQFEKDRTTLLNSHQTKLEFLSIKDIYDSGKMPFQVHEKPLVNIKEVKTPEPFIASDIIRDFVQHPLQSAYLTLAFETLQRAKEYDDPNLAHFEAAMYFAEIAQELRAIKNFQKATRRSSSASSIVDKREAQASVNHQRHLERLSSKKREELLVAAARNRSQSVQQEEERQRLRVRAAHHMLVVLHLLQLKRLRFTRNKDKDRDRDILRQEQTRQVQEQAAHDHLRAALDNCDSVEEQLPPLLPSKLKEAQGQGQGQGLEQLMSGSAGPLAEAHIEILNGLLRDGPKSPHSFIDFYEWLGRRFAEKCDFESSKSYFERARHLRTPAITPDNPSSAVVLKSTMYIPPSGTKAARREYSDLSGCGLDSIREASRDDYARFGGIHRGAATIIYSPPSHGWDTRNSGK
eukprot:gene11489-24024_t